MAIIMQAKHIGFREAVDQLCHRYGIKVDEPSRSDWQMAESYDYTDEKGSLLFQVCRLEPKDFRQRRPDPKHSGQWIWNLKEVKPVLFHLPKLISAEQIWIVEGEKDVLTMESMGFTATCNPMGAGKWATVCTKGQPPEALQGKNVFVIPDNDEPGRRHAHDVAQSLTGFAASVKIIELPGLDEREDVSDYVAKHGQNWLKDLLLELQDKTPEYQAKGQDAREDTAKALTPADVLKHIDSIPPDTTGLELVSQLDDSLRALALLPEPEAETILDSIKQRFSLKSQQVNAFRRQVREYRKAQKAVTQSHSQKDDEPTYSALFPGLVDIVLDSEGQTAFLVMEGGELHMVSKMQHEGIVYSPPPLGQIPEPIARGESVLQLWELESRFSPEQADAELYDDLRKYFSLASELPGEFYYDLLTLFALHTQLIDSFEYSPVLCLFAVPERGKTRTGKALLYVCFRGLHTETLRDAYLIRYADRTHGTIFFDVKDLWKKAEKNGCEDLLLLRFERGGRVPRVLYPDRPAFKDTVYFNIYGPTIIATNHAIDRILDTRCITVTMPQTNKQFQNDVTPERAMELKEKLLCFRARNMNQTLPDVKKAALGRLGDILKPLHQMLLLAAPQKERDFLNLVETIKYERAGEKRETLEARLLSIILQLSENTDEEGESFIRNNKIPYTAITARLNHGVSEQYPITTHRVGKVIKSLGLEKATIHGGGAAVVWDEEKIRRIAEAYGVETTSP
ncbi:MAG: toprim domain-containing protein [Desulfomonilaceae bacterium]